MFLSMILIVDLALFAVGFLWPVLWFPAIGLMLIWLVSLFFWNAGRRHGEGPTQEDLRPRHRVE